MIERYPSIIIEYVCKGIVPMMQLFALYVITHGHYSPGGGLLGGVILAASFILMRLVLGGEYSYGKFSPRGAIALGTVGVLLFGIAGVLPLATGGRFLDYEYLPILWTSGASLRSLGILVVEVGIGLAVCGVLVTIFDNLVGRGSDV